MVEMVLSMHSAVRRPVAESAHDRYHRLVTQPLHALTEFGVSSAVREGCAKLAARVRADSLVPLDSIPQHGDLFAGNVLIDRRQWSVIDWESYGAVDLPFYDVFTLLFSLLRVRGESPDHWDSSVVKEVPALIDRYTAGLSLPPTVVPFLLPLSLANWFHVQYRDGRKDFAHRMYRTMEDYFQNTNAWERVFIGQ